MTTPMVSRTSWGAQCSDRAVIQAAGGWAGARGRASLASRLQAAAHAGAGEDIADDVLLATAVAMIQSPGA